MNPFVYLCLVSVLQQRLVRLTALLSDFRFAGRVKSAFCREEALSSSVTSGVNSSARSTRARWGHARCPFGGSSLVEKIKTVKRLNLMRGRLVQCIRNDTGSAVCQSSKCNTRPSFLSCLLISILARHGDRAGFRGEGKTDRLPCKPQFNHEVGLVLSGGRGNQTCVTTDLL